MTQLPQLLTRTDVAQILGVDVSTLARWAKRGIGPRCIWLEASTVRYDIVDVLAYLESRRSA